MGLFDKMSYDEAFSLLTSETLSEKDQKKAEKVMSEIPMNDPRWRACMLLCLIRRQNAGAAYDAILQEERYGDISELMFSVLKQPVVFDEFQITYQSTGSLVAAIYVARAYENGWGTEKNHEKAAGIVREWGEVTGKYADEANKVRARILSADKAKPASAPAQTVSSAAPKTIDTVFGKVLVEDKPATPAPAKTEIKHIKFDSGDVYEGELKDGVKHGKGKYTWADGEYYDGDFVDGIKTGRGTYHYVSGAKYDGEWKDGKKHGHGRYSWPDGTYYDGDYRDGKQTGKGTYHFSTGSEYVGDFVDGKKHGRGKYTWADGTYYDGEYQNDKQTGKGTYHFANGAEYTGDFVEGKYEGHGRYTYADGTYYEGEWKDDKKVETPPSSTSSQSTKTASGSTAEIKRIEFDSGDVYEGGWKNEKKHGHGRYSWPNGAYYDGDYRDGKQTGKGTYHFANGAEYTGDFVEGKYEGHGRYTYADGTYYEGEWKNDKRHGHGVFTEIHRTATMSSVYKYEGEWIDGERHGGHYSCCIDSPQHLSVEFFDHGRFLANVAVTEEKKNWTMAQFEAEMHSFKADVKRDCDNDFKANTAAKEADAEDEREAFDSVSELYDTYKNPDKFDNSRDKNIFFGCLYMESFYTQIKDSFDETDYAGANEVLCEVLCMSRSSFAEYKCSTFDFMRDADFKKWLLTAMNCAAAVFAATDDTTGIDTPIALLNLGYYLYRRELPYDDDWLLPYLTCLYDSGAYDSGLAMGALWIARKYVFGSETVDLDPEDTDPMLFFWEETYGEDLKAALKKNAALYCDGYIYTSENESTEDADGSDDDNGTQTFMTKSGNTFTGYTDDEGLCVGWGKMIYSDGSTYLGFWKNGYRDGFGYYRDGKGFHLGYFKEDEYHGYGVTSYGLNFSSTDGLCQFEETYCENGEQVQNPDFDYPYISKNTRIKWGEKMMAFGSIESDMINGWGRIYSYGKDPLYYAEGMFDWNTMKLGIRVWAYKDGRITMCYGYHDSDHNLSGAGIRAYVNSYGIIEYIERGTFYNNELHGIGSYTYGFNNGMTVEGRFENGKLIRIHKITKANGTVVTEDNFKDGYDGLYDYYLEHQT